MYPAKPYSGQQLTDVESTFVGIIRFVGDLFSDCCIRGTHSEVTLTLKV